MTTNDHASRLAELEADNARLRRLLDKSDAPGELRHRLNSTLAMLRVIIQKSAETKRDLPDYVAHLEDRLEAIARAQHAADARGGVDLQGLLSEELLYYNILDGDQLSLQGPLVLLEPRAGQVLALAIHELAVNAIEHGPFASGTGALCVRWSVDDASAEEPLLTIDWEEEGRIKTEEPGFRGFGTEVLTRTLAYELNAVTTLSYMPEGFRCRISFPMEKRFGRIMRAEGDG